MIPRAFLFMWTETNAIDNIGAQPSKEKHVRESECQGQEGLERVSNSTLWMIDSETEA